MSTIGKVSLFLFVLNVVLCFANIYAGYVIGSYPIASYSLAVVCALGAACVYPGIKN